MADMPDGYIGRGVVLNWDGTQLKGCREKSFAFNGEPINVTTDENEGWRKLLTETSESSVDITVSGVTKSKLLRAAWHAGSTQRTREMSWEYPDGDVLTADFLLVNYTETGPYNDAFTFEATFQSTGTIVYTPGA